jgi:hypothetical protein
MVHQMKRLGREVAELTALADHLFAHGLVLEMLAGPSRECAPPTQRRALQAAVRTLLDVVGDRAGEHPRVGPDRGSPLPPVRVYDDDHLVLTPIRSEQSSPGRPQAAGLGLSRSAREPPPQGSRDSTADRLGTDWMRPWGVHGVD